MRRHANMFWSSLLEGGGNPCCSRVSRREFGPTLNLRSGYCRFGSWKRVRRYSILPISGSNRFSTSREKARRTDPELARELQDSHRRPGRRVARGRPRRARSCHRPRSGGSVGKETRSHGREPAGTVRTRRRRFRLEAPRSVAVGAPDHHARHRHQPFQRVGRCKGAVFRVVPDHPPGAAGYQANAGACGKW